MVNATISDITTVRKDGSSSISSKKLSALSLSEALQMKRSLDYPRGKIQDTKMREQVRAEVTKIIYRR